VRSRVFIARRIQGAIETGNEKQGTGIRDQGVTSNGPGGVAKWKMSLKKNGARSFASERRFFCSIY
jgi:hypothetical protein